MPSLTHDLDGADHGGPEPPARRPNRPRIRAPPRRLPSGTGGIRHTPRGYRHRRGHTRRREMTTAMSERDDAERSGEQDQPSVDTGPPISRAVAMFAIVIIGFALLAAVAWFVVGS